MYVSLLSQMEGEEWGGEDSFLLLLSYVNIKFLHILVGMQLCHFTRSRVFRVAGGGWGTKKGVLQNHMRVEGEDSVFERCH